MNVLNIATLVYRQTVLHDVSSVEKKETDDLGFI